MRQETEFDDSGPAAARAFAAFADAEPVGPSPIDSVMADGRRLRLRRRTAFSAGVTALAVLPMAAVVAYGTAGSSDSSAQRVSAGGTSQAPPAANTTEALPGRPTGPAQTMAVAQGTIDGQPWRLVRDRYSTQTMPVGDGSRTEPLYCENESFEFASHTIASHKLTGCTTADYAHMAKDSTGLYDSGWVGSDEVAGFSSGEPYGTDPSNPLGTALYGDVDPAKVASVSLTSTYYGDHPAQPVSRQGNEPVAYYVFVIPGKLANQAGSDYTLLYHFFDTNGHEVGTLDLGSAAGRQAPPAAPAK